eukprot:276416_1
MRCEHLILGIILFLALHTMAKLPDHFAESGKNIRNMRKWTLNDICEYNECNSDQQKYQIVQYGCGKVGQRTSIKGHTKRCDDCDITDPRIKVMDCVNQEWVEPKGNEVFVGFEKGTGSKRQRKKQKANTNQRGLAHFFGWSKKDPDANKTQTNHSNNRVEDTNEQDPNQTEPNHNHSHNSAEDTDSKQQELQDGWQCLEDDTSEATRSIDVGVDNRTKVTERMTEPAHLLLRYGHDGLALFEEEEDDSIKLFCENCTETVGNKDGYVWEDTNQKAAMKQVCYWHFDERSERRHGPKEPVSWKGFIPRCQAIMSTMFLTLIRMIEDNIGDQKWTQKLADLHVQRVDIGNRLHSTHILPKFKQYIYEDAIDYVTNSITTPLAATGSAGGCSISADGGSKWQHSYDFHRIKSFNTDTLLPVSAMVYAQPLTNDTNDIATQKTAAGAIASKQNLFNNLKLNSSNVSSLVHGFHADGQMHEAGWGVAEKMQKEYELSDWYSHKSDVCHEIERVNKGVCMSIVMCCAYSTCPCDNI